MCARYISLSERIAKYDQERGRLREESNAEDNPAQDRDGHDSQVTPANSNVGDKSSDGDTAYDDEYYEKEINEIVKVMEDIYGGEPEAELEISDEEWTAFWERARKMDEKLEPEDAAERAAL